MKIRLWAERIIFGFAVCLIVYELAGMADEGVTAVNAELARCREKGGVVDDGYCVKRIDLNGDD